MLKEGQGRRDATGTRSGFPCQDAVYYTAHLAFVAKSEIWEKIRMGWPDLRRCMLGHFIWPQPK